MDPPESFYRKKAGVMEHILVTGGAGYIGSHVAKLLAEKSYHPVIYDNFSTGVRDFVKNYHVIEGNIGDYDKLTAVLKKENISAVMNFASFIAVGESVASPLKYYWNNVAETISLLCAMSNCGINKFIFSSTAAVYGYPEHIPITEKASLAQINPYGKTKYFIEEILRDMDNADSFRSICLRYFNAAGADPSGKIGENHIPETHLIPLAIRAALDPAYSVTIFGDDYDTPDGTCIRDYIHVNDLAEAHILALEKILNGCESTVYNLGNGVGFSVLQIINAIKKLTGKNISVIKGKRRDGDPPILVASSGKAQKELNWKPRFTDIDEIIETAWAWESSGKRNGY